MGACVRPRDREPEAGAGDAVARDTGPREPLEERLLELGATPGPGVLDRDSQCAVDDVR